ncbi:Hypothetical protein D9617_46g064370 [Elsinoe fawcettii]|nr:Hypothetical protein D9617_46g064370 [Elsinoe fawcettii]
MDYPSLVTVITTQGFAAPTEFWTNLSETSNNIILAHVQFSKGDHRPKIEGSNLPQGITAGALHRFSDVICFVATSPDIHTELSKLWIDGNKQYGLPNKAAAYFLRVVDDKSVDNALDKHENERTSLTSNSKPYFHVLAYGMTDMSWTTSKESWPEEIAPFRVLDLDGGGVKGIVQIEALRSVSKAIGLDLPISSYFDLIVGTSIGGICAIGIGLNGWSLGECAEKLKLLIGCAFRDRSSAASKVPSFLMICKRALRLLLSGAVYSESYITSSLQSAFGKTPLSSSNLGRTNIL